MVTGRTLSLLTIGGVLISLAVWVMSENKNMIDRGILLNNISRECASNIQFMETGKHIAAAKDVADDALQEMSTGGRPQLDTRWLMMITSGVVLVSEEKKAAIKKLMTMIEVYNAELSYRTEEESYGSEEYEDTQRTPAPPKQQMIDEFNRMISVLKEAKKHKNNLDF